MISKIDLSVLNENNANKTINEVEENDEISKAIQTAVEQSNSILLPQFDEEPNKLIIISDDEDNNITSAKALGLDSHIVDPEFVGNFAALLNEIQAVNFYNFFII